MPCYYPITGYRSKQVNASGKRSLVFKRTDGAEWYRPIQIPCGRCIGCRLEYSRQWAIRCLHEAQLHEENCFLTLTYRPEDLPYGGTLIKKHHQDFMKRLRRYVRRKLLYYHAGEYGERTRRPHYHTAVFGYDFPDKVFFKERNGYKLYNSELLERLWKLGQATVGSLTFESAAYVARYATKKVNGDRARQHYEVVEPDTGEVLQLLPEYCTMSLKPAVGLRWYERYKDDVFPDDEVVARFVAMKPPKYYTRIFEHDQPVQFAKLKEDRQRSARARKHDNTPERLRVREEVKKAQLKFLKREIE